MENNKVFISHCHADKEIARVIALNVSKLSMGKIEFWYSSDPRPNGGMEAGDIIFSKIVECINNSIATIVLLTPRSINRPWIYFESGMAQNKQNKEVIPVCVGINRDSIRPPLINYSCYQLSDVGSLAEFVTKLLGKINMTFHQDVCKQGLQDFISELQRVTRGISEYHNEGKLQDVGQMIDGLKSYIDKKFGDIVITRHPSSISYTIPIVINLGNVNGLVEYVEILELDTVQTVLDKIYYLLNGEVIPYTYMDSWVLREKTTGAYLIMYEVTSLVPAKYIFKPDFKWEVIKWDGKYKTKDSIYHGGVFDI